MAKKKSMLDSIAEAFGGLTGGAVKAKRSRAQQIEDAVNGKPSPTKPKPKPTKSKSKK